MAKIWIRLFFFCLSVSFFSCLVVVVFPDAVVHTHGGIHEHADSAEWVSSFLFLSSGITITLRRWTWTAVRLWLGHMVAAPDPIPSLWESTFTYTSYFGRMRKRRWVRVYLAKRLRGAGPLHRGECFDFGIKEQDNLLKFIVSIKYPTEQHIQYN